MINEEAIRMLKAKLECMTRDVSGCVDDCNRKLCGECSLNYEQGNMGEQKECLRMSIEALERESCEDAISRKEVHRQINKWVASGESENDLGSLHNRIRALPPVTPQPKMGTWIRWYEQREYDCGTEYIPHCKCSECGKEYDSHSSQFIKYCNECGAKMQEVKNDKKRDTETF